MERNIQNLSSPTRVTNGSHWSLAEQTWINKEFPHVYSCNSKMLSYFCAATKDRRMVYKLNYWQFRPHSNFSNSHCVTNGSLHLTFNGTSSDRLTYRNQQFLLLNSKITNRFFFSPSPPPPLIFPLPFICMLVFIFSPRHILLAKGIWCSHTVDKHQSFLCAIRNHWRIPRYNEEGMEHRKTVQCCGNRKNRKRKRKRRDVVEWILSKKIPNHHQIFYK